MLSILKAKRTGSSKFNLTMSTEVEIIQDKIKVTKEEIALEEAKRVPSKALVMDFQDTLTALTEQLKIGILSAQAAGKFSFYFLTQSDVLLTSNC